MTLMPLPRNLDPLFAVSIGVTAATLRIRKDEKQKGRTTKETLEALKTRPKLALKQAGWSS
jgi:hypothetical protein